MRSHWQRRSSWHTAWRLLGTMGPTLGKERAGRQLSHHPEEEEGEEGGVEREEGRGWAGRQLSHVLLDQSSHQRQHSSWSVAC